MPRGIVDGGYRAVRPLLFAVDAERMHDATLRGLRAAAAVAPGRAVLGALGGADAGPTPADALGRSFRNRVGLAAGFDKDGVAIRGWAALGFGFVELGTVTPAAQPGNARPRLFRLPADRALVNRMGFNNAGAAALAERLAAARGLLPRDFRVGVNIGRGRDTPAADATADYVAAYRAVAAQADYVAINVSSPNTPGLRELQTPRAVADLLAALRTARPAAAARPPLLVKLAPELEAAELSSLALAAAEAGAAGVIVVNTTVDRPGLRSSPALAAQRGGLSGAPLLRPMLAAVAAVRAAVGARLTIIGCGGIGSGDDAIAALSAGADLVQVYTALVYRGPALVGELVEATAGPRAGGGRDLRPS